MVTLELNLILYDIVHRATDLTGGDDGLQGIVIAPVLGLFRFDIFGRTAYLVFAGRHIRPFSGGAGAGQIAVRPCAPRRAREHAAHDHARRADRARRVAVFAISAAMAGAAGALLTQTTQFVSPATLSFQRSADVLVILIIGGTGRLYGGFIGAIVFLFMRDWLAAISPVYWYFWIGLLLVIVVAFFRRGIVPSLETLLQRVRGR